LSTATILTGQEFTEKVEKVDTFQNSHFTFLHEDDFEVKNQKMPTISTISTISSKPSSEQVSAVDKPSTKNLQNLDLEQNSSASISDLESRFFRSRVKR